MINIIKQELNLNPELKKKIDWAIKYTSTTATINKGALIKLEPTNIAYVEPHKLILDKITLLFFNGSESFYINDLNTEYKLSDLCNYLKEVKIIPIDNCE